MQPSTFRSPTTATARAGVSSDSQTIGAVEAARPGDHPEIVEFLSKACPHWSVGRMQASFEHPLYEPPDRLLIRHEGRIAAHALTTHRMMQFGAIRLPVGEVQWFLVAPEFRGRGLGRKLLETAARHMAYQGSLVALARTPAIHFFQKTGWGSLGTEHRSIVGTQKLLSEMFTRELLPAQHADRLNVRHYRRVEIDAIERIHHRYLPGTFGPMERSSAIWRWIGDSGVFEQLFVAVNGPPVIDMGDARATIVGYAAVRGSHVLELLTTRGCRAAVLPLLARMCREAIERGSRQITFHSPATDQLQPLFDAAGARSAEAPGQDAPRLMAQVLSPAKLLREIGPLFLRRVEEANLKLPVQWSLALDRRNYLITLDARGASVTAGKHDQHWMRVADRDLAPMVLGQFDWRQMRAQGRMVVSGELLEEIGPILFPRFTLWAPPLDSSAAMI